MRNFTAKHILVPVDFSPISSYALGHARRIAELNTSRMTLMHVIEPYVDSMGGDAGVAAAAARLLRDLEVLQEKKLRAVARAAAKASNVEVRTVVAVGPIPSTITDKAAKIRADLIVMGTHGSTGFVGNMIGSNTYRTATLSPVPLLSVHKPIRRKGYSDIIFPVRTNASAVRKLPHALFFARTFGARLHAVGLLQVGAETHADRIRKECARIHAACAKRNVESKATVISDRRTADAVLSYAKRYAGSLVVISQDDDFRLVELFRGTFPKRILHKALSPVLVIPK